MDKYLPISVISEKFVKDGSVSFLDLSICNDLLFPSSFVRWLCKKHNHNIDLPFVVTDTLLEEEKENYKKFSALCG